MTKLINEFVLHKNDNENIYLNKKSFRHYTDATALKEIIKSKSFRLSPLDDLNDPNETINAKNPKKIFVTCFCNNNAERVSMWLLYSGIQEGVSLIVKPSVMKNILCNITISGTTKKGKEIQLELDKDVTLKYNWVIYKAGNGKLRYKNNFVENTKTISNSFVKSFPRENEQEFRIIIEVKDKCKEQFKYIHINFPEAIIKDFKVQFGPKFPEKKNKEDFEFLLSKGIKKENIKNSDVVINEDYLIKLKQKLGA